MHKIWLNNVNENSYELIIDGVRILLPIQNTIFDNASPRGKLFNFLWYVLENKLPAAQYIADYYLCRHESYICVFYDFKEMIRKLIPDEIDDNAFVRELLPCIRRIMEPHAPIGSGNIENY